MWEHTDKTMQQLQQNQFRLIHISNNFERNVLFSLINIHFITFQRQYMFMYVYHYQNM